VTWLKVSEEYAKTLAAHASATMMLTDDDVRAGQEALELVESLGIRGGRRVHDVAEFRRAPGSRRVSGGGGGEPGAVPTFLVVLPEPEPEPLPTELGSMIRVTRWRDDVHAPDGLVAVLAQYGADPRWLTPTWRHPQRSDSLFGSGVWTEPSWIAEWERLAVVPAESAEQRVYLGAL
jgi:hypothetical protein